MPQHQEGTVFVKIVVPSIKPHYPRNLVINAVSSDRIEPYLGLMFPVITFCTQVQINYPILNTSDLN